MSDPSQYSKRYKRALTFAILLFLGTLTASVLVTILSTADRRSLEDEYRATLTVIAGTATQSTVRTQGNLAFKAHDPIYSAAESCDSYVLTGEIRDLAGDLRDGISVRVWSDYAVEPPVLRSGEGPDAAPGRWRVEFRETPGPASRHVWVQIGLAQADGAPHYLSPPVKITFQAGDCAHNQAEIVFAQVVPVE